MRIDTVIAHVRATTVLAVSGLAQAAEVVGMATAMGWPGDITGQGLCGHNSWTAAPEEPTRADPARAETV